MKIYYLVFILLNLPAQIYAQTCNELMTAMAPDSRYTINGNEVRDKQTGLIWQRCTYGQDVNNCSGSGTKLNWQQALNIAETTRQTSGVDWRLPNIKELESLLERSCATPVINSSVFVNTQSDWYWSNSSYINNPDGAWSVFFTMGYSADKIKITNYYARLVRSGNLPIFLPSIYHLLF